MTTDDTAFADAAAWKATFDERLKAYQEKLATYREAKLEFEKQQRLQAASIDQTWVTDSKGPGELLFAVAPIGDTDIGELPTQRAAYSDRTCALMAKIARLAYVRFEDQEQLKVLEGILGYGNLKRVQHLNVDETDVLVVEAEPFIVVAFRGTTSRDDFRTDLHARFNVAKSKVAGREIAVCVHSGFNDAYNKVNAQIHEILAPFGAAPSKKPIYLTGHSLGGALALIASAALAADPVLNARLAAVYSFGCPRVGTKSFAEIVKAPHYRVVNSGDLVPLLPPTWLYGYRHTGMPVLLKEGVNRPIMRSPAGEAFFLALKSLFLWPWTRQMLFVEKHNYSLYISNLEWIAKYRGPRT